MYVSHHEDCRSSPRLRFLMLLAVLCAAGCHSFPWRTAGQPNSDELAGTPTRLASVDQGKKAQACIVTAAELARHERDDHAIEEYLRARQFDADIPGTAHPLAVLYDRKGMADAAEREYQRALKETPKNADLLNDYGYFLYSRNQLKAAETQLTKALKLKPKHPQARLNLALVLAEEGQGDEAFREFQAAVGEAAAHHNLGVILARQGKTAEAREHLEMAADLDPSLTQSRQVLACLEQAGEPGRAVLPVSHETTESDPRKVN